MKINPSQTRGLDRILDKQLGTGTSILSEGAAVKLLPGAKDQIQISQLGNRLQILVNGSEKFLLTERESQNFEIHGDQKNTTIDPSVSLYSNQKNAILSGESQAPFPGIPTERGEQLGHARRVESAFETAVTRRVITEDLKEDAFINHIGKQMQRLLGEIGGATPQQTAFRTEKDLLPFLKQLESISGNAKTFPRDFFPDLKKTVQKVQQEINNGGPVELEFLASQITRGLKQVVDSSSSVQAGRIPFEQHDIPVGESQRGAFEKWGMINDAINNNDIGKIAAFANDPSFLKLALPAEKAAFLNTLAGGGKSLNLQSMIQILQSAQSTQEFRSIMNFSGMKKIQDAFKENPAEFNLTAHIFQAGELALDSNQPSFIGSQFLKGFNPQQIFDARHQIFLGGHEDAARFAENPLLLAIASPDEKASMIQALQSAYVSMSDNRSIINILQAAMNKSEFNRIVDTAGGKEIGLALQDPVSLQQWNRLAGAYDRMDLTTDFVEGIKYSGALLEPFPFEGNEPLSLLPLKATQILRDQLVGDIAGILDTFMKDAGDWIGKQISVFDRGAFVQGGLENLNRMMDEMPLFNIPEMRNQLHSIFRNTNIRSQDVLNYLQNLASTSGLSTFDLRNLVSQPLAFIYQTAAGEATILARNAIAFFQENLQLNVFRYGPDSTQARSLKAQIERVQMTFLPFAERLQSISNVLSEAFPPPADFVTSLSKFNSSFNKSFTPILSNVFPGLPSFLSRFFDNTQSIERLVNGKSQIGVSTSPATPDISQLRSQLENVMKSIESIRNGFLAGEFSRVGKELSRLSDMPRDLIQFTKQATSFFSSIQDGSYAKTLNEVAEILKKYDDPVAELTKTIAQNGNAFLTQIYSGSFSKAHEEFLKELDNFQNSPGALKLNQFFEKLTSLTSGLIGESGSVKTVDEALEIISEIATGELRGGFTNIVKSAAGFRRSPAFRKLIDLLEGGGKFLNVLSNGNFTQNMEMMNSRFGYSPAIAQIIERGLHLTSTGSNVVKTLVARDFERPIAQIARKTQAKTQAAKEIADAETIFSTAATTFYALTEIEHMDVLWHYHRHLDVLNDKALGDSGIREFEKQTQLLAAEPDLKKSLERQFNSLRSLR